jgi:hypothetical protein
VKEKLMSQAELMAWEVKARRWLVLGLVGVVDLFSIRALEAILDAPMCQFLCCHIVRDFDTIHRTFPVDLVCFPVIIKVEEVSILFPAKITRDKLIETGVSRIFTITTL